MKSRIWVNRAILAILVAAIALGALGVQHYGILDLKAAIMLTPAEQEDPVLQLEESGLCDVLYFGIGDDQSDMLGQTPIVALGLIYYPPPLERVDELYHIKLTDNGWQIIKGRYDWNPDTDESIRDRSHLWNMAKLIYYQENALFKPGQLSRVGPAIEYLLDWYTQQGLLKWLYDILVLAESQTETEWRAIEIDVLTLANPTVMPGYDGARPGYVVALAPKLRTTMFIFRAHTERVLEEGKWVKKKMYTLRDIVDSGEFTEEDLDRLLETRQIQFYPATTMFGPREYIKGFNHPWQGRELAGKT